MSTIIKLKCYLPPTRKDENTTRHVNNNNVSKNQSTACSQHTAPDKKNATH